MTPQEKLTALENIGKMPKIFKWWDYKLSVRETKLRRSE